MRKGEWVDIGMVLLAFVSVGLLMYELDHHETAALTAWADLAVALVFLSEYVISTLRAPRKGEYAVRHWYDLLASIPLPFGAFRVLRGLRLIRLVRVLRLLRATRALHLGFIEESRIGHVGVALLITVLVGAVSFHILEVEANPAIESSLDGLYWSLATVTTVGFGDLVPLTPEGKVLAMILMVVGIGIYGSLAGLLASYLIRTRDGKEAGDGELEERLARIETRLNDLLEKAEGPRREEGPPPDRE